jgi:hypothetical protein
VFSVVNDFLAWNRILDAQILVLIIAIHWERNELEIRKQRIYYSDPYVIHTSPGHLQENEKTLRFERPVI